MGVPLADDRGVDVHDFPFHLHPVDRHRDPVRYLLIQAVERLLPDQFCHDLTFRLVRDRIFIIKLRSVREIFQDHFHEFIRVVSAAGRYRHDLSKIVFFPVNIDRRKDVFFLYHIDLVDHKDDRCLHFLKLVNDVTLPGSYESGRLHQPEHYVYFIQRPLRDVHHILAQFIFRPVDPRRIDKHDLPLFCREHRLDAVPRGLRFVGCDRDLLSDQTVHQCGFSHVRSADQCGKTGSVIFSHVSSWSEIFTLF